MALLSSTRFGGRLEREGVRRQLDAYLDALDLEEFSLASLQLLVAQREPFLTRLGV
jgi:hypothetical protein